MKMKLRELVKGTFTQQEASCIPGYLLEKEFSLNQVEDVTAYLVNCEQETKEFKVAGEHRINDWEKGWSGDGVYYSENEELNNIPYYFKNNTHIRVGGKLYEDLDGFSEVMLLRALQAAIFGTHLDDFNADSIIEYGCGTGSNISFLRKTFPDYDYYGTDWASSACQKLIENNIVKSTNAIRVDYFDPETFMSPKECNVIFTNASLEQTGIRYKDFMNFLFSSDSVVGGIHIEPIRDLLALDNELNIQSYEYAERRGYLTGFYEFMGNEQKIELLAAKDYGIGSKYISGYQVIVWKKL